MNRVERSPPPAAPLSAAWAGGGGLLVSAGASTEVFTPANTKKRMRVATPVEMASAKLVASISEDMDFIREQIGAGTLGLKPKSCKDLTESLVNFLNGPLTKCFERQAAAMSDLAAMCGGLNAEVAKVQARTDDVREELADVKHVKDSIKEKDSIKDMEGQIREAVTKFKVMDLDFGGCLNDRKQLMDTARTKLRATVRTDLRERYDTLMARASLAVIARATTKRAYPEGDRWTAPVLVTVTDREARWETEDILRKSKCFPTFHWPKDMLGPVKQLRKTITDSGVNEDTTYIRIRPEDREGKMKIRADIKQKVGGDRFVLKATWKVPALDSDIREANKDWTKPTWANVVARTVRPSVSSLVERVTMADFTEDMEVNNL